MAPTPNKPTSFLDQLNLSLFLEVIDVPKSAVNYKDAIKVIEDYKSRDLESATMALALCRQLRSLYPDWKYLADGDGGDENLKDYPIAENTELTIRSVLNNLMLYQEGWGVDKIKHSLTYSGGQSRGTRQVLRPLPAVQLQRSKSIRTSQRHRSGRRHPLHRSDRLERSSIVCIKRGDHQQRRKSHYRVRYAGIRKNAAFNSEQLQRAPLSSCFPQDETEYRSYFYSLYAR